MLTTKSQRDNSIEGLGFTFLVAGYEQENENFRFSLPHRHGARVSLKTNVFQYHPTNANSAF